MKTEIHTLRFGAAPWMPRCVQSLENWCERHNYPLTVWGDPKVWEKYPSPKFCEIDMLKAFLAGESDRMIYVDADVLTHTEAPEFPVLAGMAMSTDHPHREHNEHWINWCEENFGVTPEGWDYSNAGVWSIDRAAAKKLLTVMKPPFIEEFQEQHAINAWAYQAHKKGMKFSRLPSEWNRYGRDFQPSWFWHLWGTEKEVDLAALDMLGILEKKPDGLTHCIRPKVWPPSDKVIVQNFVQDCGLGNQMFEIAAGHGIAKRLGLPLIWSWNPSKLRKFGLEHFGFGDNRIEVPNVMEKAGQGNIKLVQLAEKRITESENRFCGISCPFQAEECFSEFADEIRDFFRLAPYPIEIPEGYTPVAVQARRSDYVGHSRLDVVTPEYFINGMEWMKSKIENPHFFFVSDDPKWCETMFGNYPNVTVMPEQTAIEGLRTMVACEAHIISNSTFGWWGAWLNEKGPVVVPEIWHQKPGSYGDWKPAPERWHRVSVGEKAAVKVSQIASEDIRPAPTLERAIVIPWHADKSVWQELRYCLRSIDKFFTDKTCPIYILGTRRPHWLLFDESRVKYLNAWSYESALVTGVQLAKQVLWMNDDILFLKPTSWEDCEQTRYIRDIPKDFLTKPEVQTNPWRIGAKQLLRRLAAEGITEQRVYSTHTPMVYKRDEALDILQRYGVYDKVAFELPYFHHHAVNPVMLGDDRTHTAPFGDAKFLNFTDNHLTAGLRKAVTDLLPDFSSWELVAKFQV